MHLSTTEEMKECAILSFLVLMYNIHNTSHEASDVPCKYSEHNKPRVTTTGVENNWKVANLFCILFKLKLIREDIVLSRVSNVKPSRNLFNN